MRNETLHFFLNSRHVAEKAQLSTEIPSSSGSQREETAEEVILQRLLRQMKLTVFALQAFLQRRQFITIKKSIFYFYIDLHSSKPNEPRQRHFSVKSKLLSNDLREYFKQQNKTVGRSFEIKSTKKCSNINLTFDSCCPGGSGGKWQRENNSNYFHYPRSHHFFLKYIYLVRTEQSFLISGAEQQLMI